MVDFNLVDTLIKRRHDKEYGGGHKIFVGSTDKNPKKVDLKLLLEHPEVFQRMKKPLPFEGEILEAPDMPKIFQELVNIKPKVKVKQNEVKSKVVEESGYIKEDLERLSFSKLKELANKLGETGRSKSGLIKDILKHN